MAINLEEKLLVNRAKKYANELDGVGFYSISLLGKDDFSWHRYKLMEINNIDNKVKHETYSNLINENYLCNKIKMLLKEKDPVNCYFFYEGRVCISIYCIDLKHLLRSIFRLNNSYDLSLSFILPDRVLAINDSEYKVDLYYITR